MIPAAGLSRRQGGPNKLLGPYGETTVIGATVAAVRRCVADVVVVTGRDASSVAAAAVGARAVFNPAYEEGLGSSIAAGVAACPAANGVMIVLGDMPGVREDVIRGALEVFRSSAEDVIVAVRYAEMADRPGHPIVFGPSYRSDLLGLSGDRGGREILRAHSSRVLLVEAGGFLRDVDSEG